VDEGNVRVVEANKKEKEAVSNDRETQGDIIATAEEIAEKSRLELKRKITEAGRRSEIFPKELPTKLRIHPDDTEEVVCNIHSVLT
jgi:rRNA maturation endonuclease Nob1